MKILLKAKAGLYDAAAWALSKTSSILPPPSEPAEKIREIIDYHGFASTGSSGFTCYIPDNEAESEEGLHLWTYFPHRARVETQIQKYSAEKRISRLCEITGMTREEYENRLFDIIREYLISLEKTGLFTPIGGGVNLFEKTTLFNLAAEETLFEDRNNLKKLEEVTVNNSIVVFGEKTGRFNVKNKDSFVS